MGVIADGIMAYAQPLIDASDGSPEQLQCAMTITQLCYNLALLPEDARDEFFDKIRPGLEMDDAEFDRFRYSVVIPMIERHQEMFPLMHRRAPFGSDPFAPPPRATAKTPAPAAVPPRIDRYAPCPCGSGDKYKFCCGKKSR